MRQENEKSKIFLNDFMSKSVEGKTKLTFYVAI